MASLKATAIGSFPQTVVADPKHHKARVTIIIIKLRRRGIHGWGAWPWTLTSAAITVASEAVLGELLLPPRVVQARVYVPVCHGACARMRSATVS